VTLFIYDKVLVVPKGRNGGFMQKVSLLFKRLVSSYLCGKTVRARCSREKTLWCFYVWTYFSLNFWNENTQ